jgi:CheY-like chemotaxis protein
MGMSDDILSLRLLAMSESRRDRDLLRQGAGAAPMPVEIVEADGAADARRALFGDDIDLVFIDAMACDDDRAAAVRTARAASRSPFVVLLTARGTDVPGFDADALAIMPTTVAEAKNLIARAIRVRLTSRVLVVDDSATMRGIVRKLLGASRFPLEIYEASKGLEALKLTRAGGFDLMFLDYNMPDFSGIETLSELKRERRRVDVVLMTAADDDSLADRARAGGAAFLKKPFYPADIENVLCAYYGLRALNTAQLRPMAGAIGAAAER